MGGGRADLFGVELVELRLLAVAPPQTQHLGLGAVGHVDELLVPPALVHRPDVAAQHDAVVAHLHEEDVSRGVGAGVHDEGLLLDVAAPAGPDRQLTAVLETQDASVNSWRSGGGGIPG